MSRTTKPKPALRIAAILFALAFNVMMVSIALLAGESLGLPANLTVGLTLAAAVVAGIATAFYGRTRGGIHAFVGGMISIPILLFFVLPGDNLPWTILAGSFCAVGGIFGEILQRRAKPQL